MFTNVSVVILNRSRSRTKVRLVSGFSISMLSAIRSFTPSDVLNTGVRTSTSHDGSLAHDASNPAMKAKMIICLTDFMFPFSRRQR
ncbi:hypothetical protein DSECCO2_571190 [anaerobic digester metagenome]